MVSWFIESFSVLLLPEYNLCIIKQLLDSASADNPYPDLDYSGYHKKPHAIIVFIIWLHYFLVDDRAL